VWLYSSQINENEKYVHKLHKIKPYFKVMEVVSQQTLADVTLMQTEFEQECF
jgi:hypothetical protein